MMRTFLTKDLNKLRLQWKNIKIDNLRYRGIKIRKEIGRKKFLILAVHKLQNRDYELKEDL
jgi:hypothetical protein